MPATLANSDAVETKTLSRTLDSASFGESDSVVSSSGSTKGVNVLHNYRSFTYNFTLAALRKEQINDPETYRNKNLDLVILKSGGKGSTGFSTSVSGVDRVVSEAVAEIREGGRILSQSREAVVEKDFSAQQIVEGFNQNSPGRFDMFIDDVEIETLMSFSKESGTALPTSVRFRVFEPYSINGFIEALHVSALAAGYPNYVVASFVLKMEFIGYPDSDQNPSGEAQLIEKTTRYFPIKFTGVEVSVNESGTVYQCAAVPWNEVAFGVANKLKRSTNVSGTTVQQILENLMEGINQQIKDDDKQTKDASAIKNHLTYEIKFPVLNENGFDYEQVNEIGLSSFDSISRKNQVYKFPPPESANQQSSSDPRSNDINPDEVKLHPSSGNPPQVQFRENQNISEIIDAVIRDCGYVKKLFSDIQIKFKNNVNIDFVKYFAIKTEVINKSEIDPVTRKPYQTIRFSVFPHSIHLSRIPPYMDQKFESSSLEKSSIREYNYIYTGQNTDVLNFKLNFNTLFFESIPLAMGDNDRPGGQNSFSKSDSSVPKQKGSDIENQSADQIPTPPQYAVPQDILPDRTGASQQQDDPYYTVARNIHSAVIDSKSSMITGEIEILGDPVFLVTGGIGNYNPKPGTERGQTVDNEVDHLRKEVLITINFRNPIDIRPLEQGGLMYFDDKKLPFSGVYRVLKASSIFNGGVFKQRLEILRIPGQIVSSNAKPTNPQDKLVPVPRLNDQTAQTTTLGENRAGQRATEATTLLSIGRGLPTPGLPGALSNFVGLVGGLGGQAQNLLNQVSGAVSQGINNLTGANSVFGSIPGGINQLASGIRLQASGLLALVQNNLTDAASVVKSAQIVQSVTPVVDAASSLASDIRNQVSALNQLVSVPGSGIGEGATVLVQKTVDTVQSVAEQTVAAVDLNRFSAQLPTDITVFSDKVKNLSETAIASATALGENSSKLISQVGSKITELTSSVPSDPAGIAASLGVNPSQLSGLSSNLQSKLVDQVSSLIKQIPEDTDLTVASAKGLLLDRIPAEKIKNIPATVPYATAPAAEVDQVYLSELISQGGPQAVANAFGVTDIKNISSTLVPPQQITSLVNNLPDKFKNPLSSLSQFASGTDLGAFGEKINSAGKLLDPIAQVAQSVESKINSTKSIIGNISISGDISSSVINKFGSKSAASPLDKLFG